MTTREKAQEWIEVMPNDPYERALDMTRRVAEAYQEEKLKRRALEQDIANLRTQLRLARVSLKVFSLYLDGPLRTKPEVMWGQGGCVQINPRFRAAWFERWKIAYKRNHQRDFLILQRRIKNCDHTWEPLERGSGEWCPKCRASRASH